MCTDRDTNITEGSADLPVWINELFCDKVQEVPVEKKTLIINNENNSNKQ